eukprot:10278645-Alexandrium_andersonii.AAC.1
MISGSSTLQALSRASPHAHTPFARTFTNSSRTVLPSKPTSNTTIAFPSTSIAQTDLRRGSWKGCA